MAIQLATSIGIAQFGAIGYGCPPTDPDGVSTTRYKMGFGVRPLSLYQRAAIVRDSGQAGKIPRFFGAGKRIMPVLFLVVVAVGSAGGCYLTPNFGPPGTFDQQRANAVLHDPHPNNDLGPPIVSGRPLGFDRPMPEPKANQYHPRVRRGAAPPPYFGF